jgi:hypothetical protein
VLQTKFTFCTWVRGGVNLGRAGVPIYTEIAFREGPFSSGNKAADGYFQSQDLLRSFFSSVIHENTLNNPRFRHTLNNVLVPAELAAPDGWFFSMMPERPERKLALMASFVGKENPMFCSGCSISYQTHTTALGEHVMFPFYGCVSHPELSDGACSNCIWNARGGFCEWRLMKGYRTRSEDRQRQLAPFLGHKWSPSEVESLPPRSPSITLALAPRLVRDLPHPFGDKQADAAAIRRLQERKEAGDSSI